MTTDETTTAETKVPQPAPPRTPSQLPSSITFHITKGERAEILRILRAHGRRRCDALLAALGIERSR